MVGPPSDRRLKDNLVPLRNPIEKLKNIESFRFEWVGHPKITNDPTIALPSAFTGESIGFIAQYLEEVLPEIVWTDEDGFKSVQYDLMVSLGMSAVKEQQNRIEQINNRIKLLKEKISG